MVCRDDTNFYALIDQNIWPIQDIGLLRAISNNYKKKYLPPKIL